ncbi:5' nucleotidase, NT5C type [Agromyces humi]|uniref:5' nucleotidase, NT5C type n=1 Tax=Agromyces humi TaxID=1766800 RepID=UPI001359B9C4|nr:hypothetical protein [Agromyces humi]
MTGPAVLTRAASEAAWLERMRNHPMRGLMPFTVLMDMDGPTTHWYRYIVDETKRRNPGLHVHEPHEHTSWKMLSELPADEAAAMNEVMSSPGLYRTMTATPGAKEAIAGMLELGWLVRFCSTASLDNPTCASDKLVWLEEEYSRDLAKTAILTGDKTFALGHVIVDDKDKITGDNPNPVWLHTVFDAPYNQGAQGPRIAADWSNWYEVLGPLAEAATA